MKKDMVGFLRTLFAGFNLSFSKIFWDSALEAAILMKMADKEKPEAVDGGEGERTGGKGEKRGG